MRCPAAENNEKEIEKMFAKIGQLEMERDYLKKKTLFLLTLGLRKGNINISNNESIKTGIY